jgi:glycosyltransferase involved in cell wall biosynthesis
VSRRDRLPAASPRENTSPAVSVVMSVYNGERFLREAIESVLVQTLAEFELIVIDDGSTDSTPEILDAYCRMDPRVVVERIARGGRPAALNHGFALARAPFVARLDADDVALPTRLARQRDFLVGHEAVAVVGGAVAFIDAGGNVFAEWQYPLTDAEIRRTFARATPIAHPAVMVRKAAFDGVGGYRPAFGDADDVDLWLRLAERNDLANVPDLVIRYRIHLGQATFRNLELQTVCDIAARLAAEARADGLADPFASVDRISMDTVRALGARDEEVTVALVRKLVWVAKMMAGAGYRGATDELLDKALNVAASASGSPALTGYVVRERATLDAAQRRWLGRSAWAARTLATVVRTRRQRAR